MSGSIEMASGMKGGVSDVPLDSEVSGVPLDSEVSDVPLDSKLSNDTAQPEVLISNPQSTDRYAKWLKDAAKRRSLKPFEERRIGWITSLPKEQVVCCRQSARDLWWITGGMILFYAANAFFCWLLSTITNAHFIESSILYGVISLFFLVLLFVAVALKSKSVDRERLLQLAEELDCSLC